MAEGGRGMRGVVEGGSAHSALSLPKASVGPEIAMTPFSSPAPTCTRAREHTHMQDHGSTG